MLGPEPMLCFQSDVMETVPKKKKEQEMKAYEQLG